MSRTDWDIDPLSLTIPPFATAPTPRMVIGPDVPADLQAWVNANFLQHVYFAQVGFDVTGGYLFSAYCYSDAIQIPEKINGYMTSASVPHLFNVEGWNIPGNSSAYSIGSPVVTGELLTVYSPFTIAGVSDWKVDANSGIGAQSMGRGIIDIQAFNTSSGAIGPAETQIASTGTVTIKNGRGYRMEFDRNFSMSVANGTVILQFYRHSSAGQRIGAYALQGPAGIGNGQPIHKALLFKNTSGADITDFFVLTASTVAGTVTFSGGATDTGYWFTEDFIAASRIPNITSL